MSGRNRCDCDKFAMNPPQSITDTFSISFTLFKQLVNHAPLSTQAQKLAAFGTMQPLTSATTQAPSPATEPAPTYATKQTHTPTSEQPITREPPPKSRHINPSPDAHQRRGFLSEKSLAEVLSIFPDRICLLPRHLSKLLLLLLPLLL